MYVLRNDKRTASSSFRMPFFYHCGYSFMCKFLFVWSVIVSVFFIQVDYPAYFFSHDSFLYFAGVIPFTFLNARMKLTALVYPTSSYMACIVMLP